MNTELSTKSDERLSLKEREAARSAKRYLLIKADPERHAKKLKAGAIWRAANRDKVALASREAYARMKDDPVRTARKRETTRLSVAAWRKRHRDEYNLANRERRAANPEQFRAYENSRYKAKRERLKASPERLARYRNWASNYAKSKRLSDMSFRIAESLRRRLSEVVNRGARTRSALSLVGCSLDHLKRHLASLFMDGMAWENYGRGPGKWNIDHIVPCAVFNLSDLEQQKACFHWSNLQPLWSIENSRKKASLDYKTTLQTTN